jgi:hypothetical protein
MVESDLEVGMKCGGCVFWREGQYHEDHASGECHRHAPAPVLWGATTAYLKGPLGTVYWPITDHTDGCGDYQEAGR